MTGRKHMDEPSAGWGWKIAGQQPWRKPSGPALSLLKVAAKRPDAIREAIAA